MQKCVMLSIAGLLQFTLGNSVDEKSDASHNMGGDIISVPAKEDIPDSQISYGLCSIYTLSATFPRQ